MRGGDSRTMVRATLAAKPATKATTTTSTRRRKPGNSIRRRVATPANARSVAALSIRAGDTIAQPPVSHAFSSHMPPYDVSEAAPRSAPDALVRLCGSEDPGLPGTKADPGGRAAGGASAPLTPTEQSSNVGWNMTLILHH